jgi:hypothetical protein
MEVPRTLPQHDMSNRLDSQGNAMFAVQKGVLGISKLETPTETDQILSQGIRTPSAYRRAVEDQRQGQQGLTM